MPGKQGIVHLGIAFAQAAQEQAVDSLQAFRREKPGEGEAVIQHQGRRRFRLGHGKIDFRISRVIRCKTSIRGSFSESVSYYGKTNAAKRGRASLLMTRRTQRSGAKKDYLHVLG